MKNGEERLLVLNRVARSVIGKVRGEHPEYVFTYRGHPITAMNNTGCQNVRKRVDLSLVRVHDLKHTFGRRLRAAGVSYEDRQDLLGHKSGRITTHYSAAESVTGVTKPSGFIASTEQSIWFRMVSAVLPMMKPGTPVRATVQQSTTASAHHRKRLQARGQLGEHPRRQQDNEQGKKKVVDFHLRFRI